jgi:hypothetical protein
VARDVGQGAGAGEGGSLVRMLRESDRDSSVDGGGELDRWSPSYWDDVGRANITEMVSSSLTAGREREKEMEREREKEMEREREREKERERERERDISRDHAQHLSCTMQTARRALRLLLESDGPRS